MKHSLQILAIATIFATHGTVNAQVKCTMPNGKLIELAFAKNCPHGATKAETADGRPARATATTAAPPQPIQRDHMGSATQRISAAEFPGNWPLTVNEGTLRCIPPMPERSHLKAYAFESHGTIYALNGTAKTHARKLGWTDDITPIWQASVIEGTRVPITPLIQRASAICN